jgi:hypothetical protein
MELPDLPPGLYLLARGDDLRTDATGTSLVRDAELEPWLADQISWMKAQTRAYLPSLGSVATLWTQRVHSFAQLHEQKSWLRRTMEKGVGRVFSSGPVSRALNARRETLLSWTDAPSL